jgi:hypothetical protein
MKDFKAKIASIHEDLELRRSLEIEEDKNIEFKDPNASMVNSVLDAAYTSIKKTIKTFDREWYNDNPDDDPVNDLMAAFKQVADLIESRYTGGERTTFFNAAEDAKGNSNFEQEVFDKLSDLEAEIETKRHSQENIVDHVADEIAREKNIEVTTEQGAVIETKVEEYFAMLNLPHPPHRVSRDALAQRPTEDRHTDSEDIIRGSWTETETELTVNVYSKFADPEGKREMKGTISTVDRNGTPRPGDMRRIEVQMERLLRQMGWDVEAPGKRGKYDLNVLWRSKTGKDIDEFKLVPKR